MSHFSPYYWLHGGVLAIWKGRRRYVSPGSVCSRFF